MVGQFWPYYERIGRGKKKKYGCLFNSCGYKLPTYQGIISHIKRTHGRKIDETERKAKEWREEQKRKKQEEIEQRRIEKELAEQELKWWEENKERIKEQRKLEEKQRQKEEARKIEIWNKVQKEIENERVRRGMIKFLFLNKLVRSNKSWQEKFLLFSIANQIGII